MQLIVDVSLVFIMFIFSYAFGRKSTEDGQPVIPSMVTWFTLFILLGVLVVLNLPGIVSLMGSYGGR